MSPLLSDRTRQIFSRSLPLFRARKHEVIDRMQTCLALAEPDRNATQSAIQATILVEMLVGQAGHLLRTGTYDDLGHIPAEHAELHITGRTYSQFGDFLVPILKDVLGANVPSEASGPWIDIFWSVIREASAQRVLEPA